MAIVFGQPWIRDNFDAKLKPNRFHSEGYNQCFCSQIQT